ncbi:MAG: threonine ammonia-lyase [Acidimicrobiia bacterium]
MTPTPTPSDVRSAAARIAPHLHKTPVLTSHAIDDRSGATVFMKSEHLQKIGAFKARGATNAVLAQREEAVARGVATHSSGNHGQAVAFASRIAGAKATIVVPDHAPQVKMDAMRGYGADLIVRPHDEREASLVEFAEATGALVVHPFDDPYVVAGQGTAALELLSQVQDIDVVLTPVGGGGLLSGSTLIATEFGIPTVGAEPEIVDDAFRSLRDGHRYPATGNISVGDGLLTGIGEIPFAILSEGDTSIVTVSEGEILEAMAFVAMRTKQVIEPSAATVFAALFTSRQFAGSRVGVIISGGNVQLDRLRG